MNECQAMPKDLAIIIKRKGIAPEVPAADVQ